MSSTCWTPAECRWRVRQGVRPTVSPEAVVVVMSNDERAANGLEASGRVLDVNTYVLAGGVNRWLDLYRDRQANVPGQQVVAEGDDTLRHRFEQALGSRTPEARPEAGVGRPAQAPDAGQSPQADPNPGGRLRVNGAVKGRHE